MYYIIQKNVFREPNYNKIFDALTRLELPFEVVEVVAGDKGVNFLTDRKDVFVFGSVRLANIARTHNWNPGSFYGGNHDYSVYMNHYKSNLLNYDCQIQEVGQEITWNPNELKFIRPCKDSKAFNGQLFTQIKWNDLLEREKTNPFSILTPELLIQVGPPKTIYKEARVWIVGGRVVTQSYYRFNGSVANHEDVDPEGIEFAQTMTDLYQVAETFVMDICLTPDGWKIVEINCTNCAGFYLGDLQKLLMALEDHFNPIEKN